MGFAGDPDVDPPKLPPPDRPNKQVREIAAEKMHEELISQMERLNDWKRMDDYFREYLKGPGWEPRVGHEPPPIIHPKSNPNRGMNFGPKPLEVYGPPVPEPPLTFRVWLRRLLRLK